MFFDILTPRVFHCSQQWILISTYYFFQICFGRLEFSITCKKSKKILSLNNRCCLLHTMLTFHSCEIYFYLSHRMAYHRPTIVWCFRKFCVESLSWFFHMKLNTFLCYGKQYVRLIRKPIIYFPFKWHFGHLKPFLINWKYKMPLFGILMPNVGILNTHI